MSITEVIRNKLVIKRIKLGTILNTQSGYIFFDGLEWRQIHVRTGGK